MRSISEQAQQVLDRIFARTTKGIKLGLQRMVCAAADVGNPHLSRPAIHVAGTNGKGSICAYLDAMLRKCGFKTGLYTSPHLVAFEERFLIAGKPVETAQWLDIYKSFEPVIEEHDLTFFEATTLIAFELFRINEVDWAIFETGLGGRLDATNILQPAVTIIGSIGVDHVQYLGSDILTIAGEKLGITKPRIPLIMYKPENPHVEAHARKHCQINNVPLKFAESAIEQSDLLLEGVGSNQIHTNVLSHNRKSISLPFAGDYQKGNALCAILGAKEIIPERMDEAINGIVDARLPGRFQTRVISGKQLIFDVAHNPQAASALVSTLQKRYGEKRIRFIVGIMKDKDAAGMLAIYSSVAGEILFARPQTPRALTTDELVVLRKRYSSGEYRAFESVNRAVAYAIRCEDDLPICVTGSFYTVGEAMQALSMSPFAD